ncbi:MAG: PilZ domain-containing protein [Sphingomonas sp.]|nr:PilZ domain-containing protein [Sphingomonas sp.]
MKFDLRHMFSKPKRNFSRVSQRHGCQIEASLLMLDSMVTYEGRVIDFSAGGAMFRPKLAYLMGRRDVPVCLRFGDKEVFAHIMRTTPAGFGLRFDDPLEEDEVVTLLGLDEKRKETDDIEFF